ncbi:glutathione peroxidase [uncultured Aquincola sp.]|uniref:glutathione peroxidase n=1 Tax=uncultured Aquincola sp. TaxID=886556 RepID=UPI0032B1A412
MTLGFFLRGLLALLLTASLPAAHAAPDACPALLDHTLPRLQDEKPINLCGYAGQVVLVVNTASYCGFTSQYKSLEALYDRYKSRGLVVLGFPSNDFGSQEPGSNAEVAAFCENTFGVKFPMFAKSTVKGSSGVNPLYQQLAQASGKTPGWNFHKYVIGRDGRFAFSAGSMTDPLSKGFVADVEKLLAQPGAAK